MDELVILPTNPEDLDEIQKILRMADVFSHPTQVMNDPYSVAEYKVSSVHSNVEVSAIVDNNILTRVVHLATGCDCGGRSGYQLAAAAMAFLILSDITIEPGSALYEKAAKGSHVESANQFQLFQIADEVAPQNWIDLALGRTTCLQGLASAKERALLRSDLREHDFARRLNYFTVSYVGILKLLEIIRENLKPLESTIKLMKWMETQAIFDGHTYVFFLHCLSPRTTGKWIKNSGSHSYERIIDGAKNAAWDLTYVRRWIKNAQAEFQTRYWLFCSNDRNLNQFARSLVREESDALELLIVELFGAKDGEAIFAKYGEVSERILSQREERRSKNSEFRASLKHETQIAEQRLRSEFA